MAEARDLLRLRTLQLQSASQKLAAAEARCRALENQLAQAVEAFDAEQIAMENARTARIAALIGNPSDTMAMVRIGLQHEAEQDAKLARAQSIIALRKKLDAAYADRDVARDARNARAKSERKIEELVHRLSVDQDQRQDAMMEDDR